MTALHAIRTADEIVILTDGAFYVPDGTVTRIDHKVRGHPDLPLVVAVTGAEDIADRSFETFASGEYVQTWEDATRLLGECLDFFDACEAGGVNAYPICEILLAGFDGPGIAKMVVGHVGRHDPALMPGRVPYRVVEIEPDAAGVAQFSRGPEMSPVDQAAFGDMQRQNAGLGLEFFRKFGADYFELYRRSKSRSLACAAELHMVGGFVEYTSITRAGVTSTKLCTWPDRIGEPITP